MISLASSWVQVDLKRRAVRVGKSKTEAGTGRTIPLNDRASTILQFWSERFPLRESEHFVFPSEPYGAEGDKFEPCVYDPTRPIKSWKEAWESAKETDKVSVRCHDLRHPCVTRMLEDGAPLSVVASILGWSAATTVRMAKTVWPYRPIGATAGRQTTAKPSRAGKKSDESRTDPARRSSTSRQTRRMATANSVELMVPLRTDALPDGERWEYHA